MVKREKKERPQRGLFSPVQACLLFNHDSRFTIYDSRIMSVPATHVSPEEIVRDLSASERVLKAFRFFEEESESINEEHARICRVAAPPFGEAARAEHLRSRFVECGLEDARLDAAGNCVALRRGR